MSSPRYGQQSPSSANPSGAGKADGPNAFEDSDAASANNFASPQDLNLRQVAHELEVKQAAKTLDELEQVLGLTDKIEDDFEKAQKAVNRCDVVAARSSLTMQTSRNSFRLLKDMLADHSYEVKAFDQQKADMEAKLNTGVQRIIGTNVSYNTFKGEIFGAHETIIGKDCSMLKVERVKRTQEKIKPILVRMPQLEKDITADAITARIMKQAYSGLEVTVFQAKRDQTVTVLGDTGELIKKIEAAQDSIEALAIEAKEKTSLLKPDAKEQRARQQKILADCIVVVGRVEQSREKLDREVAEKAVLEDKHGNCEEVVHGLSRPMSCLVRWPRRLSSSSYCSRTIFTSRSYTQTSQRHQ